MNTSKLYDAPIWSTSTSRFVRKNGVRPAANDFDADWQKRTVTPTTMFYSMKRASGYFLSSRYLFGIAGRALTHNCPINPLQRYSATIYSGSKMNLLCN